ncbi:AMP-binding protein [Vibrio mangrovi]|uniref:AMP-binding protein n=1 Tax=Vibrio mangrovi TaxID=474394 RepID=A0A1Y6IZ81_9VIBR|nr:AMP-binding protein [Vibrio mangrovi]MDW6005092.1 AMP-binding protein [Vibrio mangrovi]SMS02985.1 Acetyl-coenzyme A synthetase [Vibrio mangrovi]
MANDAQLWTPSPESIRSSNLYQFIQHINMQGEALEDFGQLHQWSVTNSKQFWLEIWQYCDVIGFRGDCVFGEGIARWDKFIAARDTIWFPQAQLNYAENLLSYAFQEPEAIALWFKNENGQTKTLTWQQLCDQVSLVQQWLIQNGVEKGDVVVAYLPHLPETIVSLLAVTSLGAIWSSLSPEDTDIQTAIENFQPLQPKVLFCSNGYNRAGATINTEENNQKLATQLSSVINTCQIEYLQTPQFSSHYVDKFSDWQAILASYLPRGINYERIGFNDPLFILHRRLPSGRTEQIVHRVGGTILNHLKEHQLHCNIQPETRLLSHCSCSSTSFIWHTSALASGATLVFYDGEPFFPSMNALWSLAEESKSNIVHISSAYLTHLQEKAFSPGHFYPLSALRTLIVGGPVKYPDLFEYIYSHIQPDIYVIPASQEADIAGSFLIGNSMDCVDRRYTTTPALGCDAIPEERVLCKNSFPNQPLGFLHDSGENYHQTYWHQVPGMWSQPDPN